MSKMGRIVPPLTNETDIKEWSLKVAENLEEVLTDMDQTLTLVKGNSVRHSEKLECVKKTLDEHTKKFDKIDERFDSIDGQLRELLARSAP